MVISAACVDALTRKFMRFYDNIITHELLLRFIRQVQVLDFQNHFCRLLTIITTILEQLCVVAQKDCGFRGFNVNYHSGTWITNN